MIRALGAMSWLRWRLLLNTVRGGRRRDAMERVSRVMALMVPVIIAALFVGSTLTMVILGFIGGHVVASGSIAPAAVVFIARLAIAIIFIAVVLLAAGAPGQTTLARYTRLLVMPIPRQALHLVEVLANVADPWQILIGAALVAFAAGLAAGGQAGAAAVAVVAALLVMAVLATLAAALGFLVAWLFRSRRRGELFTLVFVMVLSALSFAPVFFSEGLEDRQRDERRTGTRRGFSIEEFDRALPVWTRVLPSEAYGRVILQTMTRDAGGVTAGLVVLAAEAGLLFAGSAAVHRRLIQSLEGDQRRRKQRGVAVRMPRVPFIGPAASAVAWAQYRTAVRSVRGRLIVLLPGPLLAMMTVLFRQIPEEGRWAVAAAEHGHLLLGAGIVFCFYSLQAFTMNMFGSDRSGLTLELLVPIDDRQLAWGKVVGCALVLGTAVLVTLVACVAVAPTGSPYSWLAALIGGVALYLSLSPVAVWLSALFPVASDLSKTGSGGNPHPLPMLAGTFLVMAAALPIALIIVLAQAWLGRPFLGFLGVLAWTGLVTAIAIPLVNVAANAVGSRRENLALIAQNT